jgi:multidrug efflux pump subunit AcrA (membrane-fusion protein)
MVAAAAVTGAVLSVGGTPGAAVSERTVTVSRGVIETVVSGSGNLAPARQADVNFATSGRITKVYASVNRHVAKGELLARLDSRGARVAVAKAHASLVDAEDALARAKDAAATVATAAATTATVAVAAQATPPPTPRAGGDATPTATASPAATGTPAATPAASATPESGGGSSTSVESAQAAVDSALLALEEAEDAVDATLLRAPMAGTVASISGAAGDTAGASPETAFVVLAQLSKLKLEVALSESDIGKVKVGQSATVTVNAASGEQVAAHVTSVGVLSSESSSTTTTSSAVSYPVVITLDQSTDGLRPGMSATADIVVERVTGLAVPTQALRGSSVTVDRDGTRSTQQVQTGVVGDSTTQVLSGLKAGEKVIITSTSALQGQGAGAGAAQQPRTGLGGGPSGGFGERGFGGGGPPVIQRGPGG